MPVKGLLDGRVDPTRCRKVRSERMSLDRKALGRGAHVLVTGTAAPAARFGADVYEARGTTRAVILVLHLSLIHI